MAHRLLVMRAEGRQGVALRIQRLAQCRDVAMPEDRPDAGEQKLAAVGELRREIPREGLGSGEPDGQHEDTSIDRLVWPVFRDKHSVSRN